MKSYGGLKLEAFSKKKIKNFGKNRKENKYIISKKTEKDKILESSQMS